MARQFSFDLFRLNIEDRADLFIAPDIPRLRTDEDLVKLLQIATDPDQDQIQSTRSAVFKWSLREFRDLKNLHDRQILHVILARSVLEREGTIVTDDGMSAGTSLLAPHLQVPLFASSISRVTLLPLSALANSLKHHGKISLKRSWVQRLTKWIEARQFSSSRFLSKTELLGSFYHFRG